MSLPDDAVSPGDSVHARRRTSLAADLVLAGVAYGVFVASQVWLFLFTSAVPWIVALLPCPLVSLDTVCSGGLRVALSPDVASVPMPTAVAAMSWNAALFAAWGASHSLMAREWFKKRWTKVVPAHLERSVYVLVAGLGLSLVLYAWQPIPGPAWQSEGALRLLIITASLVGWMIATWATFLVDHLALFGIRPVLERHGWLSAREEEFVQPAAYRWVRHPMMTGVLIILWVMPDLSLGRAFFAVVGTSYVLIGTYFEERDLLRRFGAPYADYRGRTGRFFPRLRR